MRGEMNGMIAIWKEERDRAVMSLDVEIFKKFYDRWFKKGIYKLPLPENDEVVRIAMMKMATVISTVPENVKMKARAWLRERGMKEGL